jgi:general secretion pathway protein J
MCNWSNENLCTRANKHKGLTLIELLVAISVLGFVAVLGWRPLDSIEGARIALSNHLEQTRGLLLSFSQLQSDLAYLISPTALPGRVPLDVGQGELTLVRPVYADNQPTRLQVFSYLLKDGVLTRRESGATQDMRELATRWLTAENETNTNQGVVLHTDVTKLTMRIWVNGSWLAGANAQIPAFGSIASPAIPTELSVTMQHSGRDNGMLKIFLLGAA